MTDRMACPKCGGDFKIVDVEDRETRHRGYALECKVCEYLDFNDKQYRIIEINNEKHSPCAFGYPDPDPDCVE